MVSENLNVALEKLRQEYIENLKIKTAKIVAYWQSCLEQEAVLENLEELRSIAHKLSGSGKTFGLPSISDAGMILESSLVDILQEHKNPELSAFHKQEIGKNIDNLLDICNEIINENKLKEIKVPLEAVESSQDKQEIVLFMSSSQEKVSYLIQQVTFIGYIPRYVENCAQILQMLKSENVCALIIDTNFNTNICNEIKKNILPLNNLKTLPPIIYMSESNSFESRLEAIRAGGSAFLSYPIDAVQLIDKLGLLVGKRGVNTYHVLIVDDDEILAKRYQVALEQEGIKVTVLSHPRSALDVLNEQTIDLVLLDFNMPDCNGFELASMLRQLDKYVSLPIIFLSAETNLKKLMSKADLGIDDFLSKPITAAELVAVVNRRAQRSLVLRKFMEQDSATGLLNHTSLKKALSIEISKAQRRGSNLCYALLDLDNFKRVNDTYGHGVGDTVIKTLGHLLKQRLRRTDIIGRYGGEEFGVVLPDVKSSQAYEILNEIHDQFTEVVFKANNQEFSVTFSAGIAEYPEFPNDSELSQAADEALYAAKRQGRNRINIAN